MFLLLSWESEDLQSYHYLVKSIAQNKIDLLWKHFNSLGSMFVDDVKEFNFVLKILRELNLCEKETKGDHEIREHRLPKNNDNSTFNKISQSFHLFALKFLHPSNSTPLVSLWSWKFCSSLNR